jgi:hypothetical protein
VQLCACFEAPRRPDRNFTERDCEAAWKTIGGLTKLFYPGPNGSPSDLPEKFEEGEFGFGVEEDGKVVAVHLSEEQ